MSTHFELSEPLQALGDLLARREETGAVVVVGGTALNLLGVIDRATRDVDVIARGHGGGEGAPVDIGPPRPVPEHLANAIATVARDYDLSADWMNTEVGSQWETGLPPGLGSRVTWKRLGGLWLGLPDRIDLVFLKLYAAADDVGPKSRHFKDLVALAPSRSELENAALWITQQDPSPEFAPVVAKVIDHVLAQTP